jgi:class 3 adenylate cyclase
MAFCGECGQRLPSGCPGCGFGNPPGFNFCGECGADLAAEPAAAPVSTLPDSIGAGRYQVRGPLGEGARKRVLRAYDTRLDREVAVALIKTDGLDEAGRVRVQREAQAMGRLGDHPNIVTVHDIGEESDRLYIVSEYMAGGDLEKHLTDAGEGRLPVAEVVRLGSQVCAALEHAHARDVIHRDIKPGNVWLRQDGTAKLGDFGLAVSLDRSRLTQEGMMVGTVAYMPPEQALGRTPDARSDLYALGATLYELLAGRPPFLGDDAVAIISQHINTPPVAPSWHNAEIPKRLEALVLELLAKDPEQRPASASRVRVRLESVLSASAEVAGGSEPETLNPLDRLAGGIFVGREPQLEKLRAGFEDALSGHGHILLLVGEPGIGKTRTAEEVATYASMRGAQVLWGRCYEGEGAPAYWPWLQVIRSWVHDREPEKLMSEMGPGAADIAEVVSEVRERLPGLPNPVRLDPEQSRFRLFDSVTTFLKNASLAQPLMLVLDDLHWADRPSLLLLQFLARELEGTRLVVLGTYRDVEVGRQHPLEATLAELARAERGERILLRGLREEAVARFIELSAGRMPPRALVEAVYRETEGNPFFVHEVVRLLQSDGRLDRLDEVASWSVEIPQGVRQVVGRRLDALSDDCNRLLRVASVMGRDFELRLLADVADRPVDDVLEQLEEAEDAQVIEETKGSPGTYRFAHALVRETLYDEIRSTRRVRLHRSIAEALERRHKDHVEPHLATVAFHFCEAAPGGDVEKAVDYALRAADRATELLAYEEAALHMERALSVLEITDPVDERRRCELLVRLGAARFGAGLPAESHDAYVAAQRLAREIGSPELFAIAAILDTDAAPVPASAEMANTGPLEEALDLLGDRNLALRLRATARLALQLAYVDGDRARQLVEEALPIAREFGDDEALLEVVRASATLVEGSVEPRLELRSEALELAIRLGDRRGEFDAVGSRIFSLLETGDRDAVDREMERHRALADELRQPNPRGWVERETACLALLDGRLSDASAAARRAWIEGARVHPEQTLQYYGLQAYGLNRLRGRFTATEEGLAAGIERYPGQPYWKHLQACMYAETGRLEEARQLLDQESSEGFRTISMLTIQARASLAVLSEVVAADRLPSGADALYQSLLLLSGGLIIQGSILPFGAADRCLGNLAAVLGRFDAAVTHFEAAIELETRARARGWLPRTQCDYARALLERGESGDAERARELVDASLATSQELGLKSWLDMALELKLKLQGLDSGTLSAGRSIDVMTASIGARRLDLSGRAAADGTVTLVFSDIVGFTPMTERLGDRKARDVVREHNRIVRAECRLHGGHEVEMQGDAFLLAFEEARQAARCAVALQRAFAERNRSAEVPVQIRLGLHTGEALRDADRFFGHSVILASRIASQADGGEILVSSALKRVTAEASDLHFGPEREVELKGISDSQRLARLVWDESPLR